MNGRPELEGAAGAAFWVEALTDAAVVNRSLVAQVPVRRNVMRLARVIDISSSVPPRGLG